MKECTKCNIEKSSELFCKDKNTKDGLNKQCRQCRKEYGQSERGKAAHARYVQSDKGKVVQVKSRVKYVQSDKGKAYLAKYNQSDKGKASRVNYRANNPYKRKAHQAVVRAIKNGSLTNPNKCSECMESCRPHAHHDDYNKPIDIRWLCRACHGAWHTNNTPIQHVNKEANK